MESSKLKYIGLETVTDEHLHGNWIVKDRTLIKKNTGQVYNFEYITFLPDGSYIAKNGKEIGGKWELIKTKKIIYSPQILFYGEEKAPLNSIITRLMTDDKTFFNLILYFSSGIELVLEKNINTDVN